MKLVVTILEESQDAAIAAIRGLTLPHDVIEVRAERFPVLELAKLRACTQTPLLLTWRTTPGSPSAFGSRPSTRELVDAGIELVDVEWHEGVEIEVPERTVLSHHDYDGMTNVESIFAAMLARGCAHTKLAATPRTFTDNERLLSLLTTDASQRITSQRTVIGMSERGLYSRILAPFRGSALAFVAGGAIAAPGQLTLARALDIYSLQPQSGERVFAVAGNPVGHSLSPSIHNELFRQKRVPAVYTIASVEQFEELVDPFLHGEPCGLSVTTPFKDDAFAFAKRIGAELAPNALRAEAVNTLVNTGKRVLADNTDVDGFAALVPHDVKRAAIVGAGATARAARVALEDAGIPFTRFNRTVSKADAPLEALGDFDGDLIIHTLPGGIDVALPACRVFLEAAYSATPRTVDAEMRIGGLELLQAQAVRQHQLFMKVFDGR